MRLPVMSALLWALAFLNVAVAAPIFSAATLACAIATPVYVSDPVSASDSKNQACGVGASITSDALADRNGLHASALASKVAGALAGPIDAFADTIVQWDFMINGPAGMVDLGLALDLHSVAVDPIVDAGSHVELGVFSAINGQSSSGIVTTSTRFPAEFAGMTPFSINGDSHIVVANVQVPVGVPIPMYLSLTVVAEASSLTTVSIDASKTLTFSKTGPVFLLPDGYTVEDIPELGIVDNRFVPVPEPVSFALVALGLAAVSCRRRKGREQS